jgi:hypothetical protein
MVGGGSTIVRDLRYSPGGFSSPVLSLPGQDRLDQSCREQTPDVMYRHEHPFAAHLHQPTQQETRKPTRSFDLTETG